MKPAADTLANPPQLRFTGFTCFARFTLRAVTHALGGGLLSTVLMASPAQAQFELPKENPPAKVAQQVGLTEIALEYNSPAVKGRKIWGSVVPYDRPWSISSNQATLIRFGKDVVFGEKVVAAGTYRLYAVPSRNEWTFVISKSAEKGSLSRDGKLEGDAITAPATTTPTAANRERLTFFFSNFDDQKTTLDLEWEKLRVSVPIAVRTSEQVMAGISGLDEGWRSYANAARYMLETKKDFETGLRYANQSLALKDDWYTHWIKGALLAAKGDYGEAVEEGETAYQLGLKLGDAFVLETELRRALNDWKRRKH